VTLPPVVALRTLMPRLSLVLGSSEPIHWVSTLAGIRDVLSQTEAVALVVSGRHDEDPAVAAIRHQLQKTAPRFAVLPVGAVPSADSLTQLSTPVRWKRLSEVVCAGLPSMGALLVRAAFALVAEEQRGGVRSLAGASSRRTLERWAADTVGMGPGELLRWVRVLCGISICEHTLLPLARVADRIGYGNEAAFSRACRSLLGKAPRDFVLHPIRSDPLSAPFSTGAQGLMDDGDGATQLAAARLRFRLRA
jgi:AraC-like DNA-binding protein